MVLQFGSHTSILCNPYYRGIWNLLYAQCYTDGGPIILEVQIHVFHDSTVVSFSTVSLCADGGDR